jgi:hypothetical protein
MGKQGSTPLAASGLLHCHIKPVSLRRLGLSVLVTRSTPLSATSSRTAGSRTVSIVFPTEPGTPRE